MQPPVPVLLSAAPVVAEDGAALGTVVVYQDISTIKELQRLREEFAAIVAHDMRTPVQSVMLQLEALLRRATGEAAWVPLATLHTMKRSGEYLARLISDLLDASRLDSHQLSIVRQVFDAGEELRSLLLRLRPTLGDRQVDVEVDGGASVNADPVRFDQIVTNLLENAAKYSREQAAIRISLSPARGVLSSSSRTRAKGSLRTSWRTCLSATTAVARRARAGAAWAWACTSPTP